MTPKRAIGYATLLGSLIFALISIPANTNSAAAFLHHMLRPGRNGQILRALFTPQDDIRQTIIALIKNEKKAINHIINSSNSQLNRCFFIFQEN